MSLTKVLFVDDEVQILEGLQDLLRRQRKVWAMRFASGGVEALRMIEAEGVDVVVSDMRMPGMDGAQLLAIVKERWPGVVRVVLSGQAERGAVVRALSVAHQFLGKPCRLEELTDVIDRAQRLQAALSQPALRDLAGALDQLPSLPSQYWTLMEAVHNPELGLKDIAGLVEQDPAMSAKVLQLVNSSYFGMPQRVSDVLKAVSFLGPEVMVSLALGAKVFDDFEHVPGLAELVEETRNRSLQSVSLVRLFLKEPEQVKHACTAALLQDVGRLVLAQAQPEAYGHLVLHQASTKIPSYELEQAALGVDHADLGGYLLGIWGLPVPIVEAVTFHHQPSRLGERFDPVVAAVHLASHLTDPPDLSVCPSAETIEKLCGDCRICGHPGCRHDSQAAWDWLKFNHKQDLAEDWVRRGLAHLEFVGVT